MGPLGLQLFSYSGHRRLFQDEGHKLSGSKRNLVNRSQFSDTFLVSMKNLIIIMKNLKISILSSVSYLNYKLTRHKIMGFISKILWAILNF